MDARADPPAGTADAAVGERGTRTPESPASTDTDRRASPKPLTERTLDRLGRPRWLWVVLWSAIPLFSPFVFSAAIRVTGRPFDTPAFIDLLATQVVLAFACLVLLVGTGVLSRLAAEAEAALARLAPGEAPASLFAGIGSTPGPIAVTVIVAAVVSAGGWASYGPLPPLVALPFLCVYLLPILTFVWVDVAVLAGLNRLGSRPLPLDLFPQDRTLGLERFGRLATTGLGYLLIAVAPVLVAGSDEPVTFGISLAIVGLAVGVLALSMWRLHRQMAAAKARYVALARDLYAEAYAPVRAAPGLDSLREQSGVLGAAQSLDERARGLPTWPVDEAAGRFLAVIVTGVTTSLVVRGLFAALGD